MIDATVLWGNEARVHERLHELLPGVPRKFSRPLVPAWCKSERLA
jgi:hypothetical protein